MIKNTHTIKPDTVLKNYWRNNDQFADLFNAVLFGGEQIPLSSGQWLALPISGLITTLLRKELETCALYLMKLQKKVS